MILYGYLAREMLAPTLFAVGAFTLVVLTKDLPGFSDLVINRGAGLALVSWIVLLQAIPVMLQTLPFAVLVGGLTGLGRLSADLEVLALSTLGMDPRRLVAPVAVFGAAIALLALSMTLVFSPMAHSELNRSLQELADRNPTAAIQAGSVRRFGDWKLEVHDVSSSGRMLRRVLLWIPSVGETIFSQVAEIVATPDAGMDLVLQHGALLLNTRETLREIRFDELRTAIPEDQDSADSPFEDRLAAMSTSALFSLVSDPASVEQSRSAQSELHKRFALPSAAAIFGVLALPLALARAKPSRSTGVVVGLGVTVAYYAMVQLAEGIAQRAPELAGAAAWLPNAALMVFTALMYGRLARSSSRSRRSARVDAASIARARSSTLPAREVVARDWALSRYVATLFVQLAVICFATLVVAYTLVDILERLQWFARHGAGLDEIARFYSARIPLLVSRVAPMGLLVAMALTVSLLTSTGELLGMRSLGISAHRALLPALLVCALLTPASFLLNDQVVPRTNELADLIKQRDIKEIGAQRTAVWGTHGRSVFQLENLDTARGEASKIVVYELVPDGLPESRVDARSALYVSDGLWKLFDATAARIDPSGGLASIEPPQYVNLGDRPSDAVDLMYLSVAELLDRIRQLAADGDVTTAYEVDLHVKLATPLACLLLPTLMMVLAVSGPPFPRTALTLILAGVIGVSYTLLSSVFASFGRGGMLPPWVGGWGPCLIVVSALMWLAWRSRIVKGGT